MKHATPPARARAAATLSAHALLVVLALLLNLAAPAALAASPGPAPLGAAGGCRLAQLEVEDCCCAAPAAGGCCTPAAPVSCGCRTRPVPPTEEGPLHLAEALPTGVDPGQLLEEQLERASHAPALPSLAELLAGPRDLTAPPGQPPPTSRLGLHLGRGAPTGAPGHPMGLGAERPASVRQALLGVSLS